MLYKPPVLAAIVYKTEYRQRIGCGTQFEATDGGSTTGGTIGRKSYNPATRGILLQFYNAGTTGKNVLERKRNIGRERKQGHIAPFYIPNNHATTWYQRLGGGRLVLAPYFTIVPKQCIVAGIHYQ